jgi:hypothetical protein
MCTGWTTRTSPRPARCSLPRLVRCVGSWWSLFARLCFAPMYIVNYLSLMSCSRRRCFRASRDCSHVCRAVCHLSAVCCFRPPCVGVCGHAVRVAFLLSHGPHARFRMLKFLTRPTRGPRTPCRGCVATRFFFPDVSASVLPSFCRRIERFGDEL